MMMSEVERLTKELHFIVVSRRKTSFHAKFQVQCLHGLPVWLSYSLHNKCIVRTDIH